MGEYVGRLWIEIVLNGWLIWWVDGWVRGWVAGTTSWSMNEEPSQLLIHPFIKLISNAAMHCSIERVDEAVSGGKVVWVPGERLQRYNNSFS